MSSSAAAFLASRAKAGGWWHVIPKKMIEVDQHYFDLLKSSQSESFWFKLADALAHRWQGIALIITLLAYLFYVTKKPGQNHLARAGMVLQLALILAIANFLSDELKILFGRLKPHVAFDIPGAKQPLSFPSNHSVNTATLLGFWYRNLRHATTRNRNIGIVFLTLVWIFTAWSRVFLGEHFPLDVLGGFLFGSLYGFYSAWLLSKALRSLGKRLQK